jgi:hypothetical protein
VLGYVVKVQFRHFGREVIDGYHGPHCICRFEFFICTFGRMLRRVAGNIEILRGENRGLVQTEQTRPLVPSKPHIKLEWSFTSCTISTSVCFNASMLPVKLIKFISHLYGHLNFAVLRPSTSI